MTLSIVQATIDLAVAGGLSAAIGFERQWRNRLAGLRTNTLVALGAASFVIFGALFPDESSPTRVAAQVVSGIGFLGAGSILLRGEIVRGLTTAASLWSVAAIGLAVGGGLYTASIAATIIILIILAGIKPLERRFITVKQRRQLTMIVERGAMTFHSLHDELGAASPRVKQFVMQQSDDAPECDEVMITLHRVSNTEYEAICARLRQLHGVRQFRQDEVSS
jgi:putative Mg2+ transporter-C (MgtC) family protein